MKEFNIKQFIKKGTFKPYNIDNYIDYIKRNSFDSFGSENIIYNFYFDGYSVGFIFDENDKLMAEQLEINDKNFIQNIFLLEIFNYDSFLDKYKKHVLEIFSDGQETVIFMNKTNVYFNLKNLSKITSLDIPSRNFVRKYMKRVSGNG